MDADLVSDVCVLDVFDYMNVEKIHSKEFSDATPDSTMVSPVPSIDAYPSLVNADRPANFVPHALIATSP